MAIESDHPANVRHIIEFVRAVEANDPYAFEFGRNDYLIRGDGGEYETAQLSWNDQLLEDLGALRQPNVDSAIEPRLGETMRAFLAQAGWKEHESAIARAIKAGASVSLTIRSAAAELYALPWELLTIKASGERLGEFPGLLIRYAWPGTKTANAGTPRPEGGRIVLACSDALGAIPVDSHRTAIAAACTRGHYAFDPERDVVGHASLAALQQTLQAARDQKEPIAVLHLLCHGASLGQTFGLGLHRSNGDNDGDSGSSVIDAGRLRPLLAPHAPQIRLVILSVCDSGNPGELGNYLGSVAQALHRVGIEAVIASRFPLSIDGAECFAETFYDRLVGEMDGLEAAFLTARAALAEHESSLDWASFQLYARPEDVPRYGETTSETSGDDLRPLVLRPYRGLLPYYAEHARFFLGRDQERADVLSTLAALQQADKPRFVVVAGASGAGKTSLVFGAVIPDLTEQKTSTGPAWEHAVMRVGTRPLEVLADVLETRSKPAPPFLLVVDQFEEIFTNVSDAAERSRFVRRLWALSNADTGVSCIITVRVDYLGDCGELVVDDDGLRLDSVAYDEAHRVFVAQMKPQQLLRAIAMPARAVGLRLQDGLAERMIADVEGEPGALPLLAYTLDLLWQQRRGRELTAAAYDELGGVAGALQRKADAVVDGLDELQCQQARRLLVHLVAMGGEHGIDTRRRVFVADVPPYEGVGREMFDSVVDAFVRERLLVRGEAETQATLEVAHEALIRKWERLRAWLKEDRDKLSELREIAGWVKEWQKRHTLLQGAQLGYAARVADKYPDDIDADACSMIAESQARARRRILMIAATALSVVAVISVLAILSYNAAYEASSRLAENYASNGVRASTNAPLAAIHFFAKAAEVEPNPTQEANWRLAAAAFAAPIDLHAIIKYKRTLGAEFSKDNSRVLTWSDDATARLWDAQTGQPLTPPMRHEGSILQAQFSHDESRIITLSNGGMTQVWNAQTGTALTSPMKHEDDIIMAEFSKDDSRLFTLVRWRVATCSGKYTARLWDARSGGLLSQIVAHESDVRSALFSQDKSRILTWSGDATARLWNAQTGQPLTPPMRHEDDIFGAEFSKDNSRILTCGYDGIQLWNMQGVQSLNPLMKHEGNINGAEFSKDDSRVLTWSDDATARLWDAQTGQPLTPPMRHKGIVRGAQFSKGDSRVLTWSDDATAQLWDAQTGQPLTPPMRHKGSVSAQFSHNEARILTLSDDRTARLWNAQSGEPLTPPMKHENNINGAEFSKDDARILTWSGGAFDEKGTARLWNAQNGHPVTLPMRHEAPLWGAKFSKDDSRILTWSGDGTARLWNGRNGEPLTPPMRHAHSISETLDILGAEFNQAESHILTWSGGTALLWNAQTGEPFTPLMRHKDDINGAKFSKDGSRILTWSNDATARLWHAQTGDPLTPPMRHEDDINGAEFSKDDSRILTWGDDGTARLWNARSGEPLSPPMKHQSTVLGAQFSKDEARILTWSPDGTVRLWDLPQTGLWPKDKLVLRYQVRTGTRLANSGEIEAIPADEWLKLKQEYDDIARNINR